MIYRKNLKKLISIVVIIAFVFQADFFLYSQSEDEIAKQFQKAKNEYNRGQYVNARNRIERIIGTIKGKGIDRKDILGKCYLLLGAVYEKLEKTHFAEENYRKAKEEFNIKSIEGIDFEYLKIHKREVRGIIEKEKKKKKFPVLLVIAGVVVIAVVVILLMKKKKSEPSPTPEFVTNVDSITVPEGDTAEFNVKLSAQPSSDVSVSVANVSGDSDIVVQSDSFLTFTSLNWNQNQTVTLNAAEDPDYSNGTAIIRIRGSGVTDKDITATEEDNDLKFVTDENELYVPEGRKAIFKVWLSGKPESDITATVSRIKGDTDIYVQSGGTLTFTTSNWRKPQEVTLRAANDLDNTDSKATFRISAPGVADKDITAIEDDDEITCKISVAITSPSNNSTVSGTVSIQAEVSGDCTVGGVEFFIDNEFVGTVSSTPYIYFWDTSTYSAGSYTIKVRAFATTGESAENEITVKLRR